jgi:hypothetical protein
VSNLRERNKIIACGQSFVTRAVSFNKCHVSLHARLRSAVGEPGKWSGGGEKCLTNRSRSATPAAEPQTEARRVCGTASCKLVTSVRFEKRNGRRREGDRADGQPVE